MVTTAQETIIRENSATRTYTVAEYMTLSDDGKEYELVKGKLVEMPGPAAEHSGIMSFLDRVIGNYAFEKKLGLTFTEGAFVLDPANKPNNARRPDVAFVSARKLKGVNYSDAFLFPPDLAVEVISKSDIWFEVLDKVTEYVNTKVPLIWVVVSPHQQVFVYELGQKVKMLLADEELEGGAVIPGFKLKVSALFDWADWIEAEPAQA